MTEQSKRDDTRPFPIQGSWRACDHEEKCTVPWWLAEIAYEHYASQYGTGQSLERIAERGGFGRTELVSLIRRES